MRPFRSRGPQPPAAEARLLAQLVPGPRRLRPWANNRTGRMPQAAALLNVQLNIPGLLRLFIYRVKAAGPGMCDFPFRRESGTRNRIPGDFFVSFFGRAKKEMPRRHEAFGEAGARGMSGQKNKRPLATDIQLNLRLIVRIAASPNQRNSRVPSERVPWRPVAASALWFFLFKERTVASKLNVLNKRTDKQIKLWN